MATKYKLKQKWAESGVIIRGVTGVITKDNLTDGMVRKICALGLAQRFLEEVPDVQQVTEEKVKVKEKVTRPRKRKKVTEKAEEESALDENQPA